MAYSAPPHAVDVTYSEISNAIRDIILQKIQSCTGIEASPMESEADRNTAKNIKAVLDGFFSQFLYSSGYLDYKTLKNIMDNFLMYLSSDDLKQDQSVTMQLHDLYSAISDLLAQAQSLSSVPLPPSPTVKPRWLYLEPAIIKKAYTSSGADAYWYIQQHEKSLFFTKENTGTILALDSAVSLKSFPITISSFTPLSVTNNHHDTETAIMLTEEGNILKINLSLQASPEYQLVIAIKNLIPILKKISKPELFWHENFFAVNCEFFHSGIAPVTKCLLFYKQTTTTNYSHYDVSVQHPSFITLASATIKTTPDRSEEIVLFNQYEQHYFCLDKFTQPSSSSLANFTHIDNNNFCFIIENERPRLLNKQESLVFPPGVAKLRIQTAAFSPTDRVVALTLANANSSEVKFIALLTFDDNLAIISKMYSFYPQVGFSFIGNLIFSPNGKYLFALSQQNKPRWFGAVQEPRCFLSHITVNNLEMRFLEIEKQELRPENIKSLSWQFLRKGGRLALFCQMKSKENNTLLHLFDFQRDLSLPVRFW